MKLSNSNIFILFGLVIFLILTLIIFKSYLVLLAFTLLLVYVLNPLYKQAKAIFKFHSLSAIILIICLLLVVFVPFIYMFVEIGHEIQSIDHQTMENSLETVSASINSFFGTSLDLSGEYKSFLGFINEMIQEFVYKIPLFMFHLFIIIFVYYYFSRDYAKEIVFFRTIFNHQQFTRLKKKFKDLIGVIIYGQIFVRFVQAIIGTIGFLFFGVEGAVILGVLMFFASFLPLIGTGLIWIPVVILNFLNDQYVLALAILLIGLFISVLDNFLLPHIISGKTNIGPVTILISILGGLEVFGIYGLLLGPFIVGVLFLLVEEAFSEISKRRPLLRKFVWTEKERERFRKLKSEAAKQEYIKMVNRKYEEESQS